MSGVAGGGAGYVVPAAGTTAVRLGVLRSEPVDIAEQAFVDERREAAQLEEWGAAYGSRRFIGTPKHQDSQCSLEKPSALPLPPQARR